ncbi:MAG TPA: nucleotide exchange factor GrpE [Acidimicrobiales bacterium]|nr:nucleotide exchange factor GrpE [Acidimicrobiales bacterium]
MSDAHTDPVEELPDEPPSAADAGGPAPPPGEPEVIEGELLDEDAPGPEGEVTFETLLGDLERVAVERDQFLDAYRRAQADFENFKKQSQRRADDEVQRRLGSFVERFLPVLDACDAARQHGAGDEVEPIMGALMGALEKEGLERIDPAGEPFDPAVAEAVVHEPGDGGEHVVSEVLRAGYSFNGRVLRPAMVKVTD